MKNCLIITGVLISLLLGSCIKERYITSPDATVYFTEDSLFFDTLFTQSGSVTKSFKIVNANDQKLKLSEVRLAGGNTSLFKINIGGRSGPSLSDITLNANDSLYVFVQVNVDPNNAQQPFILRDSIEVSYNGSTQWMQLSAYGQNAIFLKNKTITGEEEWTDSLPYVVSGYLLVDTNAVLKIKEGTRIFLHADAPVLIDGKMIAEGTISKPVVFAGDRLDEDYKDLPAAWPGIFFRSASEGNVLKHTIIKNAYQGIIAQDMPVTSGPKVTISQCVVQNIYDVGILGLNTSIHADNSLIANCGSNIALLLGGDYSFVNCTVASYGSFYINHKNPVLQLTDFYEQNGTLYTAPATAGFVNCIFWGDFGNVDNEILVARKGAAAFDVSFTNSIFKAKDIPSNVSFLNCLQNTPPLFDSINTQKNIYDFHLNNNPNSPAINAGIATIFPLDLDGKLRDARPDIGCYER